MSKQDWETPPEFIRAVRRRFGNLAIDLASSGGNAKADRTFTEQEDSLKQEWCDAIKADSIAWLNPPFADIEPWVRKAAEWSADGKRFCRTSILILVPASIGTNWFAKHVHQKAFVWGLQGRMTFYGATAPYPKDLMLLEYGHATGFGVWDWRKYA